LIPHKNIHANSIGPRIHFFGAKGHAEFSDMLRIFDP
jgi:hypothetical protein